MSLPRSRLGSGGTPAAPPRRVLIVINRRSGGPRTLIGEAARALSSRFETAVAGDPTAASARLRALPDDGSTAVVVCGGDGTVNRLLPDLMDRNAALAIFPTGTVNDLARELDMRRDVGLLLRCLETGAADPMDLLSVGGHPVATYASIGLGARLSRWAMRTRPFVRPLRRVAPFLLAPSYAAGTVLLDPGYRRTLRVRSAGMDRVERVAGIFVGNQRYLNGDVLMSGSASNADGIFETYVVRETRRLPLLKVIHRLQTRKDRRSVAAQIPVHSGDRLLVTAEDGRPFEVFGDGEPLFETDALEFGVRRGALRAYRGPRARSRAASASGHS